MNDLKNLIKTNYKYCLILFLGILVVIFSSVKSDSNVNKSNVEKELCKILEMSEGVGDVDVMLNKNENNIVEGAIIVADGAENPEIKKILHDSAVAILNLPDYKIQILKKQK